MKNRKNFKTMAVCLLFLILLFGKAKDVHAIKTTYTGYKNIDYIAERMVRSAGVTGSMSDDQKVKSIYHYMTTHFKHTTNLKKRKTYYNTKKLKAEINAFFAQSNALVNAGLLNYNKKYKGELDNMIHRAGDCVDMAKIFVILCKHVGVKAETCRGYYKNRSGKRMVHSWNYAVIDGKRYYYDVDVEIKNYKKGQGDYYWYKKTYSEAKKTHVFK